MSEESKWFYERITALESQLEECRTRYNELEASFSSYVQNMNNIWMPLEDYGI